MVPFALCASTAVRTLVSVAIVSSFERFAPERSPIDQTTCS